MEPADTPPTWTASFNRILEGLSVLGLSIASIIVGALGICFAASRAEYIGYSLGAFLPGIAALGLAGRKVLELERKLRPRLITSCGSSTSGSILFHQGQEFVNGQPEKRDYCFRRIRLDTLGIGEIKDCRAALTSIDRDGTQEWGNSEVNLTFFPFDADNQEKMTIPSKMDKFVEVLVISDKNKIFICNKKRNWFFPKSIDQIFSTVGKYTLTVKIISPVINTMVLKLMFDWTGDWKTSELSQTTVE